MQEKMPWVYKSRGLMSRLSSFLYFRCILTGKRRVFTTPETLLNHPLWDSSDPDIKSEELLWGRCRVEICYTLMEIFYLRCKAFGHSNLQVSSPPAETSRKRFLLIFFSYHAKTKVSVFSRKPSKTKKKITSLNICHIKTYKALKASLNK